MERRRKPIDDAKHSQHRSKFGTTQQTTSRSNRDHWQNLGEGEVSRQRTAVRRTGRRRERRDRRSRRARWPAATAESCARRSVCLAAPTTVPHRHVVCVCVGGFRGIGKTRNEIETLSSSSRVMPVSLRRRPDDVSRNTCPNAVCRKCKCVRG